LKLAGRRAVVIALASAAIAAAFAPSLAGSAAGANYSQDVVTIEAGSFVREDIFLPTDGSPWHLDFDLQNGSPVDVYVLHTTDALASFPGSAFTPIEFRENVTAGVISFSPASRFDAYSLVIDNTDNSRLTDVAPHGAVTVRILRSSPIRSDPQAEAALATGTGICAVVLIIGTIGLALHLKRRPHAATDEALAERVPRLEVDVAVPARPRGAWASQSEDETDEPASPQAPGGRPS
jgi:hypothetical protein